MCPTLCDPMDCSLPGSSLNGVFQARVLEWKLEPFPSSGDLPDPGIELGFPVLWADVLQSEPPKSEVSSIVLSRWIPKVDELMTSLPRHRGLAIGHRDRVRRGLG